MLGVQTEGLRKMKHWLVFVSMAGWLCVGMVGAAWASPASFQAQVPSASLRQGASLAPRWRRVPRQLTQQSFTIRAPSLGSTRQPAPTGRTPIFQQGLNLSTDLITASLIVLIPTVAVELTLFIGNLAAFSMKKNLLAWGIQGIGFSVLGAGVTLPWIIMGVNTGLTVSFIALHLVLLGVSITNVVLATQNVWDRPKVTVVPWGTRDGAGVAAVGTF